jgi:hypothetical protein
MFRKLVLIALLTFSALSVGAIEVPVPPCLPCDDPPSVSSR